MSINFIQERLAHLDGYLRGIESRFASAQKPSANSSKQAADFAGLLDQALGKDKTVKQASKSVKAQTKTTDDFSKLPEDFDQYIKQVSSDLSSTYKVEISPSLVKSVIKQESGFNPQAVSQAGAQGLMQLMPATAKSVGVFNPLNPYQNLKGGVTYLAQMLQKFDGNLQKALAAYNAGPKAVEKYNGVPPYTETKNYVESIMSDYLARENYKPFDLIG